MIIKDMYTAIKTAGINVYMPGTAKGKVTTARVILHDAGITPTGKTTGVRRTEVTVYVPVGAPTEAYDMIETVRLACAEVDNARYTGDISEGWIDADLEAYGVSAYYESLCSLL